MKNVIEVSGYTLKSNIDEMCWKKAGFKDRRDLLNTVRNLPAEERLEMLTEMYLEELAKIYLTRKTEFVESLGGHPGIKKEEILEWARSEYKDTDKTEWRFDVACDYYVDPSRLQVEWYNREGRQEWLKEQRRKRA